MSKITQQPRHSILKHLIAVMLIGQMLPAQVTDGTVDHFQKISKLVGNLGGIVFDDGNFGNAITPIGDINGDGIPDMAVGEYDDDDGGGSRGAVFLLFMKADGNPLSTHKISYVAGNFPTGQIDNYDNFGQSVAGIGDLNNDGVPDIAVGAYTDDDGGTDRGAVYILFMNANGTVSTTQKISDLVGGFGATLDNGDLFGSAMAPLGDLDGDSVPDLAVSSRTDDDGGTNWGAFYILFLNTNGTVKSYQKVSSTDGNFAGTLEDGDFFGYSLGAIGDLDEDGIMDIAVGTIYDDDGGASRGAAYILFMNANGTVKTHQKISNSNGGFTAVIDDGDNFGSSVSPLGDIDGDGVLDLAVGAWYDDDGGSRKGAVYLLYLKSDGTVKSHQKISDTVGGFGSNLLVDDYFGWSVSSIGDLDGDGLSELVVGSPGDIGGGRDKGAIYVLYLKNPLAPITAELMTANAPSLSSEPAEPLSVFWKQSKQQSLYLASDLTTAGIPANAIITDIAYQTATQPGVDLQNLRLAYAQTVNTTLPNFETTSVVYGPIANYSKSNFVINEWEFFTLDYPIGWNGTSSLIIEYSIDATTFSTTGGSWMRDTGSGRSIRGWSDTEGGNYPYTTGLSTDGVSARNWVSALQVKYHLPPTGNYITFNVDMTIRMRENIFLPATGDQLAIRGDYNSWVGNAHLLTDTDGDSVYTVSVANMGNTGTSANYKFVMIPAGGAEVLESIDPYRSFLLTGSAQTIATVYFDDDATANPPIFTQSIQFQVDMANMITQGIFAHGGGQTVEVRGPFTNWINNGLNTLARIGLTNVYAGVIDITEMADTTVFYKYYVSGFTPEWVGWEKTISLGDGDRGFIFDGSTGQTVPTDNINMMDSRGLLQVGDSTIVTISIDMDSASDGTTPFNSSVDQVYLLPRNQMWLSRRGDDPDLEIDPQFRMYDTNSDGIYEVEVTLRGSDYFGFLYQIGYTPTGTNPTREGATTGSANSRVRYIAPFKDNLFPATYTFPTDTWTLNPPMLIEPMPDFVFPKHLANSPSNNATNVPLNATITASFDDDMGTATSANFVVSGSYTGIVEGNFATIDSTITFTPTDNFKAGEVISTTLTTSLLSADGGGLDSAHVWSFTAAALGGTAQFAELVAYESASGISFRDIQTADLDGDGDLDVIIADANTTTLHRFLNNGDGTFSVEAGIPIGASGQSMAVADFDNDGYLDIAVTTPGTTPFLSVVLNNGDGTFRTFSTYFANQDAWKIHAADLDGDGFADLALSNFAGTGQATVLLNNQDGTFAAADTYPISGRVQGLHLGDIDNDGDIDIIAPNFEIGFASILLNHGNGQFAAETRITTGRNIRDVVLADMDGDSYLDIAAVSQTDIVVGLNDGSGTFETFNNFATEAGASELTPADFDGDGDLDLGVGYSQLGADISTFLNSGNGALIGPNWVTADYAALTIASGDLDGDGDLDIAIPNISNNTLAVLLNNDTLVVALPPRITLHFSKMNPHLTQKVEARLIDLFTGREVARTGITPVDTTFDLVFTPVPAMGDYEVEIWADFNNSGTYDAPGSGGDHSWRFQSLGIAEDSTINFEHHTNFIDVDWTYLLTADISAFDIFVNAHFEARLTDRLDGREVFRRTISTFTANDVLLKMPGLVSGKDYDLDLYSDSNGNDNYDAPPFDRSWSVPINAIITDHTVTPTGGNPILDWPRMATVVLTGMSTRLERKIAMRLIDNGTNRVVVQARRKIVPLDEFSIDLPGLKDGGDYRIDFYIDNNGNEQYDAPGPGGDDAWRIELGTVPRDTLVAFTNNSSFTDIEWRSDIIAPTAPTGLVATSGDGQVFLEWDSNSEDDLSHYDIYGGISSPPNTKRGSTIVGDRNDTDRTITNLTNDVPYFLRLTAIDTAGNESSFSAIVNATPAAVMVDADSSVDFIPTTNGPVTFGETGVTLDITFSSDNGADTINVTIDAGTPDGAPPTGLGLVGDRYWTIIHNGPSTFSIEITLVIGAGTFSAEEQAVPGNIRLLRRESDGSGSWTAIRPAISATDSSVTFANLTGFSQFVLSRATVTDIAGPQFTGTASSSNPSAGQAFAITSSITDVSGVHQARVWYLRGNQSSFSSADLNLISGTVFSSDIPPSAVTIAGLLYYLTAMDSLGNISVSDTSFIPVSYAAGAITSAVTGSAILGGFPYNEWRLISLPTTPNNSTVGAIVEDELGVAASDDSWMLHKYVGPGDEDYESATTFAVGRAYFLKQIVSEDPIALSLGSGQAADLRGFELPVQSGSWRFVGAPYPFNVTINADQAKFNGPFTYGAFGSGGQAGWSARQTTFRPWGGYIVYNKTGQLQQFSMIPAGLSKAIIAKSSDAIDGWTITLTAVGDRFYDGGTILGRIEGATDQFDSYDAPEPPLLPNYLSMVTRNDLWPKGMYRSSDLRSSDDSDGVWDIEIATRGETGPIALTYESAGEQPSVVVLLDMLTREIVDLSRGQLMPPINDYNEHVAYRLKMFAGSQSFVDRAVEDAIAAIPVDFALLQNFPNPFNPTTVVPFALPKPAFVSVKVYNLLGQEVATLVNGWQAMGNHETIWDGRDGTGNRVASGVYFSMLQSQGVIKTKKMVLLK